MEEPTREQKAMKLLELHVHGCEVCARGAGGCYRTTRQLMCTKGRALKNLVELTRKKYEFEEEDQ